MDNYSSPVPGPSDGAQPPMAQTIPDAQPPTAVMDLTQMFSEIAQKIIAQQETIIGPVAVEQAKRVKDLSIDWSQHRVDLSGNPQQAIDELVEKYKELFGQIAVQVSREAAANILAQIPADQQPKSLVR